MGLTTDIEIHQQGRKIVCQKALFMAKIVIYYLTIEIIMIMNNKCVIVAFYVTGISHRKGI